MRSHDAVLVMARGRGDLGTVSLFGTGIRSETHREFKPGRLLFPLNQAMQSASKANPERLTVTFVPVGALIVDKPPRTEVKSPVRVGKANLLVEVRKPGERSGTKADE